MIYISHRGLLEGPDKALENTIPMIEKAISVCGNVEIDLWIMDNGIPYLGHDKPEFPTTYQWLNKNSNNLWIHCKNITALEYCDIPTKFHYFWHETDVVTLTSKGFIWAYPGKQPIVNSIAVLPEWYDDDIYVCLGDCTDYVLKHMASRSHLVVRDTT